MTDIADRIAALMHSGAMFWITAGILTVGTIVILGALVKPAKTEGRTERGASLTGHKRTARRAARGVWIAAGIPALTLAGTLAAAYGALAAIGWPLSPTYTAAYYTARAAIVTGGTASGGSLFVPETAAQWSIDKWRQTRQGSTEAGLRRILVEPEWTPSNGVTLAQAAGVATAGALGGGTLALCLGVAIRPRTVPKKNAQRLKSGEAGSREVERLKIGQRVLAPADEIRHVLASGTTGSGKSQVIRSAYRIARRRGEPAIVLDWSAELTTRLYRPGGKDAILAPHDARSVPWCPISDMRAEPEAAELASALIAQTSSDDPEWTGYARAYLEGVLTCAYRRWCAGELITNYEIGRLAITAEPGEILKWLDSDHPTRAMLRSSADKMISSIRTIVAQRAGILRSLDPDAQAGEWSIGLFVDQVAAGVHADTLWVPIVPRMRERAIALGRLVVEIAINRILDQTENEARRIWMLIDELGQYPKIDAISAGTSLGRKYGLAVVAAVQGTSQLSEAYGHDGATSLLTNFATKAIFAAGDAETGEWASKEIGDRQERYQTTSTSRAPKQGGNAFDEIVGGGTQTTTSTSEHVERRRAVMASEIQQMQPLRAYVRTGTDRRWTPEDVQVIKLPEAKHAGLQWRADARSVTASEGDPPPAGDGESGAEPAGEPADAPDDPNEFAAPGRSLRGEDDAQEGGDQDEDDEDPFAATGSDG